jgi:hypothetical protein
MKYYFIGFVWENVKLKVNRWEYAHSLINIHPLEWVKRTIEFKETHKLISYQEITKEEYDKYKNWLD